MKKIFNIIPLLIPFLIFANFSCTKKEVTQVNSFTWTFDGIPDTSTLNLASLHNYGTAGESKIIAGTGYTGSYMDKVWISLPSLNSGNYALGPGTVDTLKYFDNPDTLHAISGSVNISENKDSHISGSFSATLVNNAGTNKLISGNFTYVEIYP